MKCCKTQCNINIFPIFRQFPCVFSHFWGVNRELDTARPENVAKHSVISIFSQYFANFPVFFTLFGCQPGAGHSQARKCCKTQCNINIFPISRQYFASILPIFRQYFPNIFPIFFRAPNIFPIFSQYFFGPPIFSQYFPNIFSGPQYFPNIVLAPNIFPIFFGRVSRPHLSLSLFLSLSLSLPLSLRSPTLPLPLSLPLRLRLPLSLSLSPLSLSSTQNLGLDGASPHHSQQPKPPPRSWKGPPEVPLLATLPYVRHQITFVCVKP